MDSPKLLKHKEMYKNQGFKWKDAYRKRCHERLKDSRSKFLSKFRHDEVAGEEMVKDVMREEWKTICCEHSQLPSLSEATADDHFEFELRPDENIDEVLYVFEEIRAELIREEQQILQEYEAGLYHDDAVLESTVNNLQSDSVLCPICQKNPLMLNKGVIFCNCGVRIDTEQDCITLANVKHNLEEATLTHSEMCETIPGFGIVNQLGVVNLIMSCKTCDHMHIIV